MRNRHAHNTEFEVQLLCDFAYILRPPVYNFMLECNYKTGRKLNEYSCNIYYMEVWHLYSHLNMYISYHHLQILCQYRQRKIIIEIRMREKM